MLDLLITDTLFIAALYSSKWISLGLYKLDEWDTNRMKMRINKRLQADAAALNLEKTKKQQKNELAEKSDYENFLARLSTNPWTELNCHLSEISKEFEEIRDIVKTSLTEIARLKKTKTVTLAIVGEFSSGKSTFINSILERELLRFSNDECTCVPVKITYGSTETYYENNNGSWIQIPENMYHDRQIKFDEHVNQLKAQVTSQTISKLDIEIVDTPGANSKNSRYEERTLLAIEDADACIVLMDSAQDGSKSFLEFLNSIRIRQKRIFLLLSRADMRTEEELSEHIEFTIPKLSKKLNINPSEIFFVGLKESSVVKLPITVFKTLSETLRSQRVIWPRFGGVKNL